MPAEPVDGYNVPEEMPYHIRHRMAEIDWLADKLLATNGSTIQFEELARDWHAIAREWDIEVA